MIGRFFWFFILGAFFCAGVGTWFFFRESASPANLENIVHIYNWAEYLPRDVLDEFEKETGITVLYDSFDSLEALETKIFTNPGYDVVFPPAWPLFVRCVEANILLPLNYDWIPNAALLDPWLLEKLKKANPKGAYGVPYLWGTTGIGVNHSAVLLNEEEAESWGVFFHPTTAEKLKSFHLFLLDSALDVFQAAMLYLGHSPTTEDVRLWNKAIDLVYRIRPYIQQFTGSRQRENLLEQKSFILQGFSTYLTMAALYKKTGNRDNISYYIPKEGAMVWFDMMAIPRGARHVKNAHRLINFILQPKIMAQISNCVCAANPIPSSKPWIKEELLNLSTVFLTPEMYQRLHADFVPSAKLLKYLSRAWLKIKMDIAPLEK